ncbi:MAG: FUSC family protein [Brevundimonas sp.]
MSVLGWPHAVWALISVLFVLQLNSDATRQSLSDRLRGTAVGSLIGLAAVVVLPGEAQAVWRVPIASFAAMAFAVSHPHRSYVMVAAIAVALESSDPAWTGALERIRAIAMGSFMAMAVSVLIWREPARVRSIRALAAVLEKCRALSREVVRPASDRQQLDERRERHAEVHQALRLAQACVADCRDGSRTALDRVERRIERIWHDLVFIDRASAGAAACPGLTTVSEAVCRRLDHARQRLLRPGKAPEQPGEAGGAVTSPPGAGGPLAFALEELQRDLSCLDQEITGLTTTDSPRSTARPTG